MIGTTTTTNEAAPHPGKALRSFSRRGGPLLDNERRTGPTAHQG